MGLRCLVLLVVVCGCGAPAEAAAPPTPPAKMRAFAVKVDLAANAFVLPGVRVDVLLTRTKEKTTSVVLPNLLVLAVEAPAGGPEVVTLAVTTAQAQQLALAVKSGTLGLVVRAPGAP